MLSAANKLFHSVWTRIVFWVGDIRSLSSFPWVTWAVKTHMVEFEEIKEAMYVAQRGDIGLHRDKGYLSNIAIPGFMKHAWIHIEHGDVVEAISEGVVRRSAFYPLYTDFGIIVRPRIKGDMESISRAVGKAKSIIGENYDVDFRFDIEKELRFYEGKDAAKSYDPAFSCTEVVSFSWWHESERLGIKRSTQRGKQVILADDFLSDSFEIVWVSDSVTFEAARAMGLHQVGLRMLSDYLETR